MAVETFHRAGHHVQSAHGRRRSMATDGSHLQGGMIALMPTAADAKRLAIGGGEKAAELHLTLMFLGDDMSLWDEGVRSELVANLSGLAMELGGPVEAKVFGVSRWNGTGQSPAWVWNVGHGNDGDSHALQTAHTLAVMALEHMHDHPDIPAQYEPWQPHICAAYTKEAGLLKTLEQRLGPVTFDRLRVSFGDDDHDIPLEAGLTASALRREPTAVEVGCAADFASIAADWEAARDRTATALEPVLAKWRASLHAQVVAHLSNDDPEALPELRVDTLEAEDLLRRAMLMHARRAGEAMQREAEAQGVTVPPWTLPEDEDAVTAAVGGRRLISSIAKATSDLMASTIVQSAKRKFSTLFHTAGSPEQIAEQVDEVLAEDPGVQAAVGTAMSTAQNVGRQAVLEAAPPAQYYASEILDRNTCAPCKEVDGEEFETLAQAIKAYPVMGYGDCVGPKYGNACRGLIVARWTDTPEGLLAHGTIGRPGYRALHPGAKKERKGKEKHKAGGMVGSDLYSAQEHEDVALDYGGRAYRDMNAWLRSRAAPQRATEDETVRNISVMNDLIAIQEPSTSQRTLYRGTRQLQLGFNPGDEFHDMGFMSTSEEEDLPRSFTGVGGSLFKISVPPGTRMLEMGGVGGDRAEKEWVLPPGTKRRVTQAHIPESELETSVYEVEVIPDGEV